MKKFIKKMPFGKKKLKKKKKGPYVIYKLDGKHKMSFLISKYADLEKSDDMFSSVFNQIRMNGKKIVSTRLESLGKGKILYKSSDGLYAVYREAKTKSIYLLMYIDYGEIEKWFAKIKKGG